MISESDDDKAALARSLSDPDCFRLIFRHQNDRIYSYVVRRVGPNDADDVAAEIWLAAFATRTSFDPSRGTVVGWLYGIARNLTVGHHRNRERRTKLARRMSIREASVKSDHAHQVVEGVNATAALPHVLAALARLPARDRELLELRVWDQLAYQDIAQVVGIPVGTVRSRLFRARARLANLVDLNG